MPTVYPLIPNNNASNNSNNTNGSIPAGGLASIPASKIIQSYDMRFVKQEQIDRWDSLVSSIEQNNGINYRWYQSIKVTQDILDHNNLITLPNKKSFYDLDSKSLVVHVNDKYIAPIKYNIVNKRQLYFKVGIIQLNDVVHIMHMNKENRISNYDTTYMALATTWQYTYKNDTGATVSSITLPEQYAFMNQDKYSLLVYKNGELLQTRLYNIPDTKTMTFDPTVIIANDDEISMVQMAQVLPNEEYIGFMWGQTIKAITNSNIFTLPPEHAFSNRHDKSCLVFVDGKITRKFSILNSNTIRFDDMVMAGQHIEIIQLGYTTDLVKIKELLQLNNLSELHFDPSLYVKKADAGVPNGYLPLNLDGKIDLNFFDIPVLMQKIKQELENSGWAPNTGGGSGSGTPGGSIWPTVWRFEGVTSNTTPSIIEIPAEKVMSNSKNNYLVHLFGNIIKTTDYELDVANKRIMITNPFYQQPGMSFSIWHIHAQA